MALSNTHLKKLHLGNDDYLIEAKYLTEASTGNGKTYEDIVALINKAGRVIVLDELPEATAETYAQYKDAIVLVPSTKPGNVKDEYIIIDKGEGQDPRYAWEKIGDTHIDLTDYAKWGVYPLQIASDGAHTHTVDSTGTVQTVELETKKLGISRSTDVAVGVSGTATALGTSATFSTTVTPQKKTLGATSSAISIAPSGKTEVVKAVGISSSDVVLGEATTFAVTGGALTDASAAVHGNDNFVANVPTVHTKLDLTKFNGGSITDGSVTGGVYSGATQAAYTQGTFTPNTPTTLDVSKFNSGSLPSFTQGEFTQGTLPSYTQGSKAAFSMSVTDGVLSFSFSANGDDTFDAGTLPTHTEDTFGAGALPVLEAGFYNVGTAASHADDSFTKNEVGSVSPIVYTKQVLTPASLGTGFYTEGEDGTPASYTQGKFTPNDTGTVSAISVTANSNDRVTAVTGIGATETAEVVTGVDVTAQPVITLAYQELADAPNIDTVEVVADITGATTTVNDAQTVNAVTGVNVTTQPVLELNGDASAGVDYAKLTSTSGTIDISVSGTTASNGAHAHNESTVEVSESKRRPLPTE